MSVTELRALFDRQGRREARVWAEKEHDRLVRGLDQNDQLANHGPTDDEWTAMAVAEERRMRLALEAKQTWRDARPRRQLVVRP